MISGTKNNLALFVKTLRKRQMKCSFFKYCTEASLIIFHHLVTSHKLYTSIGYHTYLHLNTISKLPENHNVVLVQ